MKDVLKFIITLGFITVLVGGYVSIQLIILAIAGSVLPTWLFVIVVLWLVSVNYRVAVKGDL